MELDLFPPDQYALFFHRYSFHNSYFGHLLQDVPRSVIRRGNVILHLNLLDEFVSRHRVSVAEVLANCLNNSLVSRGREKPRARVWVRRLSRFAKLLVNEVVMASKHSFNVAMRNTDL
jgi:ribosomal protein L31E